MSEQELRELDAELAVKLFGWEWMERIHNTPAGGVEWRKAIFGPEPWVRMNYHPGSWHPAKPEAERFSDWDTACFLRAEDGRHMKTPVGLPRYTTDPAATMQVLEKLTERRGTVMIGFYNSVWVVSIGSLDVKAETLPQAICKVAREVFK